MRQSHKIENPDAILNCNYWHALPDLSRDRPTALLQVIRGSNGTNITAANLCANAVVYKDQLSRLERLPNELWIQVFPNSSMVTADNSFRVESFTTQSARQSGNFVVNSTDQHSATTFSFMGTGVQFISCIGPQFGVARIYLDGKLVEDIDASITPDGITPDQTTGFCEQLLYSITLLPYGLHNLTVENLQRPGLESQAGGIAITIGSFSYLSGSEQCALSSDPESAYAIAESSFLSAQSRWANISVTGIIGSNVSTVSFQGVSLNLEPDLELTDAPVLVLPPATNTTLATDTAPVSPLLPLSQQFGPPVPPLFAPQSSVAG